MVYNIDRVSGVYQIVNLVDGKSYIGSSVSIYERIKRHRNSLRNGNHDNPKLQNAWNKYGEDSFEFRILHLCPKWKIRKKEQEYIETLSPQYNIAKIVGMPYTPERGSDDAIKRSKNSRISWMSGDDYLSGNFSKKITASMYKRWSDDEYRKHRSSATEILWEDVEYKSKIKTSQQDKWKDPEYRETQMKLRSSPEYGKKAWDTKRRMTPEIVREIRKLRADGMTCSQVAKIYGVSNDCVSRISSRKSWDWVE